MTYRAPRILVPPTLVPSDPILAMQLGAGALHEQVVTPDGQTRTYISRILMPPEVVTVDGNPRYEVGESTTVPIHVFDFENDVLYVMPKLFGRNQIEVRNVVLAINPRTREVISRFDLDVLPFSGTPAILYPVRARLGFGGELHIYYFGWSSVTMDITNPAAMTIKCRTPAIGQTKYYEPMLTPNLFFTQTATTGVGPTLQRFTRSITSGVATYVSTGAPVVVTLGRPGSNGAAGYDIDRATGDVWFCTRSITDDANTTGQAGRIAAKWNPTTDVISYVTKRQPAVAANNYPVAHPMVVNSEFYFNTYRTVDGNPAFGLTKVSADLSQVSYFGEYDRQTKFGYGSPWLGPFYPSPTGFAYLADQINRSVLYVYDLSSGHATPDKSLNSMGTAYGRQTPWWEHDTFVSVQYSLLSQVGYGNGMDKQPPVGIPANPSATTPPVWDVTAPVPIAIHTPPVEPYQGILTEDYTFPVRTNAISSPPSTPNWHRIVHTGNTSTVIYIVPPTTYLYVYQDDVSFFVHAALYTPEGRVFQRLRAADTMYHFTGVAGDSEANSSHFYGFVIPSYMPAGNYYLGVLPDQEGAGVGTTYFSDYNFEGYSPDLNNGDPGASYRLQFQTHPAETEPTLPCVRTNYPGVYPWKELTEVNADVTPTLSELYDDPLLDGVSFNINLGGYAGSWTAATPFDLYVDLIQLPEFPPIRVSGMYLNGTGPALSIDLWSSSNSYPITDPTQIQRYEALRYPGGITPGHTVFPGVASYAGTVAYIQPKFCNAPILYEQWYSLNPNRTDPLMGYDGYSFAGDVPGTNFEVWLDDTDPSVYIRRAAAGIFRVGADLSNVQPADCVAAMVFVGTISGGVLQLIVNGQILATQTLTEGGCTYISVAPDYIFDNSIFHIGQGTSLLSEFYADAYTANFAASVSIFRSYDTGLFPSHSNPGLLNMRHVKAGFYLDAEGGGPYETYNANHEVNFAPGMFYTLPSRPIPCDPTGDRLEYIPRPIIPLPPEQ